MYGHNNFNTILKYKGRAVFSVALAIIFYRTLSRASLSSMFNPPYPFKETEMAYRLLYYSHIPQLLTSNFMVAELFYLFLILFPAILFLRTLNRINAIVFTLSTTIYFFAFNMAAGHHYHSLAGLIVITVPFWFKKEERFNALWEIARYYWLYIFSSAALWKIFRGTVFYKEQLSNILKSQQLDLLLQNPDSMQARAVQYLIAHPGISHTVLIANVILQLSFLIGFFTKRYDAVLFCVAIIFCVANYFVMSIVSAELLILNLTLINWDWLINHLKFSTGKKTQQHPQAE